MPPGAKSYLNQELRRDSIVGGGATKDGVGQIGYDVASERGQRSLGVASSNALEYGPDGIYTGRNHQNFFVRDNLWGGIDRNTGKLSPTSNVLVSTADKYVAAGGGDVMAAEARAMMGSTKGRESVAVNVFEGNHEKAEKKFNKAMDKWNQQPVATRGDAPVFDTAYGSKQSTQIYGERYN